MVSYQTNLFGYKIKKTIWRGTRVGNGKCYAKNVDCEEAAYSGGARKEGEEFTLAVCFEITGAIRVH